ncbi:MAG TPA: DUF5668 domain-containing protein [Candidatus Limnocylindria bacterium]|nr:DUF5668 domain-containing protein [Candidatus Limnocylindria bacterium]
MTTPTTPTAEPRWSRRRGVFWPLVLIAIGIVFLLGNYGLIQPVSFLSFLALWPVLLILLGLDIAFARRWPLGTLAAEVVIIGLGLLLAATQPNALSLTTFSFGRSHSGCADPRSSVSVPRGSLQSYRLDVSGGAARYRLTGGASAALEATADHDELCLATLDSGGPRGEIRLTQAGGGIGGGNDITVKLANDLPVSLNVNAGAGEFDLDLHDIVVTDARLNIGASSTTLVLPRPTGEVAIRAAGGASSLVIEIPADVEARVTVTGALVSLSTTNPRVTKSGLVVETPGYATANDRVTVSVTGGATSVAIR